MKLAIEERNGLISYLVHRSFKPSTLRLKPDQIAQDRELIAGTLKNIRRDSRNMARGLLRQIYLCGYMPTKHNYKKGLSNI